MQSFTYNSHDVLTNGTAGSETDGYDLNGNETSVNIYGETYGFTWDDEDRLTSLAVPGVGTDTFTYNGLGLRVGKTDSTGTCSYVCDGTSPGSPVLSDGHALYTPGLSENRGGVSAFYSFDQIGNLWTADGTSKNQLTAVDYSAFGCTLSGSAGTPVGYGGANGCLTDPDASLVLMGHRYYDARIGRFISQDPAGEGDNWYAYAGNNPVNKTDPSGLTPMDGPGSSPLGSPGYFTMGSGTLARGGYEQNFSSLLSEALSRQDFYIAPVKAYAEGVNVPTFLYRGGGKNPSSLTPRPGNDTVGEQRGLSAYDTVEGAAKAANKPGGSYQTISTDNLTSLNVVQTGPDGHYSIRPDTQAELDQWAATKGTGTVSPYTKEVQSALVGSPGIFPDTPCPICP